jgi:hypothetical protein
MNMGSKVGFIGRGAMCDNQVIAASLPTPAMAFASHEFSKMTSGSSGLVDRKYW